MQLEWLLELRRAIPHVVSVEKPLIVALATVDSNGFPHARSIAIRDLADDGTIWFTADSRSSKITHLDNRPNAEIVAWIPSNRQQFRVFGKIHRAGPSVLTTRARMWSRMSDLSRAMFFWPAPGESRTTPDESFRAKASQHEPMPENFAVLYLEPTRVEQLILSAHPHDRLLWRADTNWTLERINP